MREVEPWGGWELRVGWNPTPPRKPGSPGPLTPLKRIAGKGSFSVDGLQVARPVRCSQVRVRFCRVDILEAALSSPPSVRQSECLQALPDILRESAPPRCWRLEPRWPHGGPSIPAGEAGEPVCGGPDPGLLVAPLPPLPPGGRSRAARGPGAAPCPVPGLAPARSAHKGADAGAAGAGAVPERPPRRHPGLGVQPPAPEWRGGRGTAGGALGPSNLPRSVLSNEGTSGCDRRLRGRCWKGRKWRDSLSLPAPTRLFHSDTVSLALCSRPTHLCTLEPGPPGQRCLQRGTQGPRAPTSRSRAALHQPRWHRSSLPSWRPQAPSRAQSAANRP
ncbi:zinc finger protein 444 isoform X11 [Onychomys torridus]|uniref:zinc finger protein 444 isoform X11 n=1 Tax=Onychomys torridus TaxID=38674 RepID=UPI00167FB7DF|nr:zinc finger protein 444 isoform X11 [Onychomys torridus]